VAKVFEFAESFSKAARLAQAQLSKVKGIVLPIF
jgi:hypothetical protein